MDIPFSSAGSPSPPLGVRTLSGADQQFEASQGAAASGGRTFMRDVGAARILVIEDEWAVRSLSVRVLQQAGYRVDEAIDGEFGWEALQSGVFKLLLTDNRMPRLSGVDLIARLRAAGMTLPAILVSGTLPWNDAAAPPELQPIATLGKPFVVGHLLAKVDECLRAAAATLNPAPLVSAHG
ncbi:MAG TPA: response regulator [Opitutaceae bacterium]|nr:response regulator [Opitutaceae bacterium]